jgi:IS30 family transposase
MKAPHLTRRRWTSEEERKLDELLDAGKEGAEIAVILNRSRQAVYALLQRRSRKQARLSTLARPDGLEAKK